MGDDGERDAIMPPAAGAIPAGIDAASSGVTGREAVCAGGVAGIMGGAAKGPDGTIAAHCVGGPWGWAAGITGGAAATIEGGGVGAAAGWGGGLQGFPNGEPPQAAVVGGGEGFEATSVVAAGWTPCVW
jgi:hypothetical protein